MSISVKHRVFDGVLHGFIGLIRAAGPDLALKAAVKLRDEVDVVAVVPTRRGPVRIWCGSETVRVRAMKMTSREPDTLAWIEGFGAEDVLWDIGSNIGVFTLYAALSPQTRVVAFDPLPDNYAGLCRNLILNGFSSRVMAFCMAVSDTTEVSSLHIPAVAHTMGGSGSTIGLDPSGYGLNYGAMVVQRALQVSVDDFAARDGVPFPNHIKMDIDGVQDKVVSGARKTLRDPRLKSVMLELPPVADMLAFIDGEMEAAGFRRTRRCETAPGGGTDATTVSTNNFYERA